MINPLHHSANIRYRRATSNTKILKRDGVIDNNDQAPLENPIWPVRYWDFTLGANYKGFSINLLFQGSFDTALA